MKPDIQSRPDIEQLVDSFYAGLKEDDLLGPIFLASIGDRWDQLLPRMYTFWENVLFHSGGYQGNPMAVHLHLHQQFPMSPAHFERWLTAWETNVRRQFAGPNADNIVLRAHNIGHIMAQKLERGY
jgi:hemoglobin